MSMRSKALENIRAIMEREDNTYRRENGYEETTWEHFRPEPAKPKKEGNFLAGRFLGTESIEPVAPAEPEPAPAPVPEPEPEPVPEPAPAPTLVPEPEPQPEVQDTEPEIREVIPLKEGRHSWLYNEVVKAINDAARENSGTKIIAVFIPVVQNGKELEELPVTTSIELSPVSEEDVHVERLIDTSPEDLAAAAEPADHVDEIIPETRVVPDPELVEAFQTMEEKLDESIAEAAEEEPHEEEPHDEEPHEEAAPDAAEEPSDGLQLEEPELGDEAPDNGEGEEPSELLPLPDPAELDAIPEVEGLPEVAGEDDGNPLAFFEEEEEEESKGEPMVFVEQPADDEAEEEGEESEESRGEPMIFEDISVPEEIPMPDELEDDEIEILDGGKQGL